MPLNRFWRGAALFGAIGLAVWAIASAVTLEAHASYDRSEPADGAVLARSPARVDVWFSQELRRTSDLPKLDVVNFSGDVLSTGAVLDDDDRSHVFAELPPALPNGRYTVIWETLSDEDDADARGAFHFFVDDGLGGSVRPTPDASIPAPPRVGPPPPRASVEAGVPAWTVVVAAIGGIAIGGGVSWLARRPLDRRSS